MNTSFQRGKQTTDEWYTPRTIVEAFGEFDLDPCAPSLDFYTAKTCFTKADDGLSKEWHGRVWLNPPYSRPTICRFVERMAAHGNGIALLFDRMDSGLWHDTIFPTATAILIMRGRIGFIRPDGTQAPCGGCGSVFVAWGEDNAKALRDGGIKGKYVRLN